MPLPSALAARLSKRGIIAPKKQQDQIRKINFKGLSTCPNKSNVYHECNYWCESHWKGVMTPDPRYVRNMQKLLFKYPLPNNWTEIFDKGVYYYWNMENDLVSWLPPRHPKSVKTQSAAKIREKRILANEYERSGKDSDREDSKDEDGEELSVSRKDKRDRDRDDKRHKKDDRDSRHSRKKSRKDLLDPMDPAAYSDVPQGTWSDGLENNKIRADSTASGVLYQQRPYPAPGEVLASNSEKTKKK